MKVTMFWSGGSSYAPADVHSAKDAEVFQSIADAKQAFAGRCNGHDTYYPCVSDDAPEDGGPEAHLFFGDKHPVVGQEYPDRIMRFGPRGGVVIERT